MRKHKRDRINKNARNTAKAILRYLLIAGTVSLAASSPRFSSILIREIFSDSAKQRRRYINSFNYLKRNGFIDIDREGLDVHVSLTKKGEWVTGKFEFNDLEIFTPKKWDGKWRVVIFDIRHEHRIKRDMFRTKLKALGFYSLQKSVWAYPYECRKEVRILRDFLDLDKHDIRVLTAEKIDNDELMRRVYGL